MDNIIFVCFSFFALFVVSQKNSIQKQKQAILSWDLATAAAAAKDKTN